ncbi:methylmalonyl-CoA mutase small subunit [Saccharopolyspora sp. HNM0983]|uniref:Methylmalonyl-CoA mutase small subunit n=1 Tax=Saccharopolyspora montiporae TaxID=2781240 RepID=A0A929B4Y4_9PSEU|nr:methylmalonyl-CoA mutase family protein [Saccharopolyspora sp. HNM0983]MBE9373234.1 methylmalonyl-CoA mutase small subunit [Saccharopolyspora sp. HNM0983]
MVAHSTSSGDGPALPLAADFPAPTHEQWQSQVEKALRKTGSIGEQPPPGPVEDVLASTTYEGIEVHPLYTGRPADPGLPGLAPYLRGARPQGCVTEGWQVRQLHACPDPQRGNKDILADLYNGSDSLWLRLGPGGTPVAALPELLGDVHLEMISVVLDGGAEATRAAEEYLALAAERGVPAGALRGNLGADPLGEQARTGQPADREGAVQLARHCPEQYPQLHALVADALPYHEAGGSDAEELGCALATATTYLRWLVDAGVDVAAAAGLIEFRFAATADQFLTIAKLRAARQLWAQITRSSGAGALPQQQHAVTSPVMLTRHDPWVNMLRGTIAAFAAGVGGAQAISTLPFDAAVGMPDAFSRRIARNTQALLLDESHLAQVIDPAGGSWYVETLTGEIAAAAWEWFQRIEGLGGMPAALDSGAVAERLATTWQARTEALDHRTDAVIGVSEFPNLDEQPLQRDPAPQRPGGGLPRHRHGERFEALRTSAAEHEAATGARPTVHLATIGPLAAYNARASFARNLFAAGGIDATEGGPSESTSDVVAGWDGNPVVCLCSTDKLYAERAAETAEALRDAGAQRVLLAGKPGDEPPAGVDDYVFTGCDALAVLTDVQRRLGVAR